jgi:nardilysin
MMTEDMDQDKDEDEESNDDEDEESHDSSQDPSEKDNDGLRDAAAAMVVGVGSMYDPPEAQGLAHLLEHMLFMGTQKYPEENAYSAFLAKHGGSDNAYTEIEYTVYHLEIPQEKLFPALDMFAQFFVHPLMKVDAVQRELKASNQSFSSAKTTISAVCSNSYAIHRALNRFCKFSWGNLQSLQQTPDQLGVNVMDLLRKFYRQYYFAANMRLVVIGAYSLDELQKQVEHSFAEIPPDPRETPAFHIHYQNAGTWDATFHTVMSQNPLPMPKSSLQKIYSTRASFWTAIHYPSPGKFLHKWNTGGPNRAITWHTCWDMKLRDRFWRLSNKNRG